MTRFANVPGAAVLTGGSARPTSSPVAAASEYAQLLADCARWQALQEQVVLIRRRRAEIKLELPERFRNWGIDPRGWADVQWQSPLQPKQIADLREFERVYIALGLDKIEDTLDSIWNEQGPLMERIRDAEPKTVAGALASARVWMLETGEHHLVDEFPGDAMHDAVLAGLCALDAGDALLARGRAPA